MEPLVFNNQISIIVDLTLFISGLAVYYLGALRSLGPNDGFFDVELLVRNTEALITATSILLPGTLIVFDIIRDDSSLLLTSLFYASLWFLISILIGVSNIFRLPTVLNDHTISKKTKMNRVQIRDIQSMLIGLAQLLSVLIGSVRATVTFIIS